MNIERIYELIRRQATSGLSPQEADELAGVKQSQRQDVRVMETLHRHTSFVHPTDDDIEMSWNSLEGRLQKEKLIDQTDTGKRKIRTYSLWAIAASFILLATTFFVLQSTSGDTYVASNEVKEQSFEDGSLIVMNEGSKITTAKGFGTTQRKLGLNGEAFISAEHTDLPLIVESDHFTVEVVGTKFNVMDYGDDDVSSVTLYEGQIKLTLPNHVILAMTAGERVTWNKSTRTYAQGKISSEGPGWLDGSLRFDNMLFSEVFTILERTFDVQFEGTEVIDELHWNDLKGGDSLAPLLNKIEKSTGMKFTSLGDGRYRLQQQ